MANRVLDRRSTPTTARRGEGLLSVLRRVDYVLIGTVFVLTAVGLVIVYSATRSSVDFGGTYYVKRQLIYLVLGVIVMFITMSVDYRRFEEWAYAIYGFIAFSLLVVFAVGHSTLGSQRSINFGPINFQPSEFGVLALTVVVGAYVSRHEGPVTAKMVVVILGLAAFPMLLVFEQPDLGTTIIMGVVLLTLTSLAGVPARYLLAIVVIAVLGFLVADKLHLIAHYQLQRLTSFLHPSSDANATSYNLYQAETAIGAGGMRGAGLFNGQVTNLGYVPEVYADFIFSAIGEQVGFVGCVAVLGLFGLLAFRIFRAMQIAGDQFGRLLCAGALAFVVFSVFQNVGMNIGLMPITGIPLPFISYGGSALLAFFAAIGLVVNVEMHRRSIR